MNIIQTFWTGPSTTYNGSLPDIKDGSLPDIKDGPLLDIKGGWPSCEYHWMSWALSCLQATRFFGEVRLITDLKGKEILIDRLGLPYGEVSTPLEKTLDRYPPGLWSLAKIFSYSLQDQPFLHLDGDVFLWERPDDQLLQAGLIAQNLEKNLFFYRGMLDEINRHFTDIPDLFLKERYENGDILACNAGFFGGHDTGFIRYYCSKAFEFVDRNFSRLSVVSGPDLNFIFEQYLLYQLAEAENIPVTYYMRETVEDPVYKDFIRFEDLPFVNMIHPVGGFKRSLRVCNHLARKLRKEYPDYYYRIIKLVREEGITMMSKIYTSTGLKDNMPVYDRTLALIGYFNRNNILSTPIRQDLVRDNDFLFYIESELPDGKEREMLSEIYQFESEKNKLLERLYGSENSISLLYQKDKDDYDKLQAFFSLPETAIIKGVIFPARNIEQKKVHWNWKYPHEDHIIPIVEKNHTEEKRPRCVILAPFLLQMKVDEYYLDTLDLLIFETVKQVGVIEKVMEEVRQYFEADEINANPYSFAKLILDSVKRLLYAGILEIYF